jgi:hypothetical protein
LRRSGQSKKHPGDTRAPNVEGAVATVALAALAAVLLVTLLPIDSDRVPMSRPSEGPSSVASSPPVVFGRNTSGPASTAGARTVGERFLRGYVAFLYGRLDADALEGGTGELTHGLRQARRRVPPARAGRRPRIARLYAARQAPDLVQVTATVDDGDLAAYPVTAFVQLRDGRWVVTHLADD